MIHQWNDVIAPARHMSLRRACAHAAALSLALALAAHAQAAAPRSVCATSRCELQLTTIATLEARGPDTEIPHTSPSFVTDNKGRIFVAPVGGFTSVAVYTVRGRFLQRLGGDGAGPGEFRMITQLFISPSDTLYVMDSGLERLSVYDQALRFIRTIPMVSNRRMVATASGRLFAVGDALTGAGAGYAVHEFSSTSGERLRSFISEPRLSRSVADGTTRSEALNDYLLAGAADETVIVSRPNPMRFTRLSSNRLAPQEFSYQPSWLPHPAPAYRTRAGRPATSETYRGQDIPLEPIPRAFGMEVDANNHALLLGSVPAPSWRGQPNPRDPERLGRSFATRDWAQIQRDTDGWYDTVIELVDLPSGRLIASARTSAAGYRVISANTLAVLVENDDGGFDIRIVRVVVR